MMNVCFQCGLYHADKIIDPSGPFAICPECGFKHRFVQLPLFIVSGASGAGKSTVCHNLLGKLTHVVLLDSDILWRPEFNTPDNNYRDYFETWLRMCKNISQSGQPVVLFGAGVGVPENIEPRIERRYFSAVEYLALVCNDDILADRLKQRPAWRGTQAPAYIEEHQRFNQWFKTRSATEPFITLVDTTEMTAETAAMNVTAWINEKLNALNVNGSAYAHAADMRKRQG
jgi:adenylate kinase